MKVKTGELIDHQLDWAVATCMPDSAPVYRLHQYSKGATIYLHEGFRHGGVDFRASRSWAQGGPIMTQYGVFPIPNMSKDSAHPDWDFLAKRNHYDVMERPFYGPTPLIAAMRCLVASRLGDEVEIPEELK